MVSWIRVGRSTVMVMQWQTKFKLDRFSFVVSHVDDDKEAESMKPIVNSATLQVIPSAKLDQT